MQFFYALRVLFYFCHAAMHWIPWLRLRRPPMSPDHQTLRHRPTAHPPRPLSKHNKNRIDSLIIDITPRSADNGVMTISGASTRQELVSAARPPGDMWAFPWNAFEHWQLCDLIVHIWIYCYDERRVIKSSQRSHVLDYGRKICNSHLKKGGGDR